VEAAARRIVPALGGGNAVVPTAFAPVAVPEQPSAAWDVFGEVQRGRSNFVTTVSITTSGGLQ